MNCQNCHELLEPSAAFCGNCGFPVQPLGTSIGVGISPLQPQALDQSLPFNGNSSPPKVPSYALADASQHAGETQALLAVIFGVIGIVGSGFLIPIIGLFSGVAGLCAGTVSRRKSRRRLAIIGLFFSSVAIICAFSALAYNIQHEASANKNAQFGKHGAAAKVISRLSTPCFSFNLIDQYNISNKTKNCDVTAYNGQTFTDSTSVYKIIATNAGTSNPAEFTQLAKQAIDTDIRSNLPDFTVTTEGPTSFAGSLAYSVYAVDNKQNSTIVETGVLHQTPNGDNAFDILHAINGSGTNLQTLEAQWQWK